MGVSRSDAQMSMDRLEVVSDIWPPFVTGDRQKPGIDVETMQRVFERMGLNVSFNIVPWKRALLMVEQGKADALLDAFRTPDRLKFFLFPEEPMHRTETALFCLRCNTDKPVDHALFYGRILVINRGYRYSRFGNDTNIRRIAVNDFEQGFKMLAGSRADFYLVNRYVGLYTLSQLNIDNVKVFAEPIEDPSPAYLAFHKSDELYAIHRRFSRELKRFKQTDDYLRILRRYGVKKGHRAVEE